MLCYMLYVLLVADKIRECNVKGIHVFPSLYLGVPIFIAFPIKRRTRTLDTATSKHNSILRTKSEKRKAFDNFPQIGPTGFALYCAKVKTKV